jgi:hypothetical protein
MAVFSLYRDFFRFLQALEGDADPWEWYQKIYLDPHKKFFRAYWSAYFPQMDLGTLQDRVRRVRRGHYSALEHLLQQNDLERQVQEILARCLAILPSFAEPDVFIIIGFFSPDGFLVTIGGRPAIGIGLERFRNLRLVDIILAHEYGHYARRLALGYSPSSGPESLEQKLLSEGLSISVSRRVCPGRRLCDYLLMSPQRLNWCQENEARLMALARPELGSDRLVPVFFGCGQPDAGIPARTGLYLGHRLVERALQRMGWGAFKRLLAMPDIAALWPTEEGGDENGDGGLPSMRTSHTR